ncbi:MAG TPA: hypothetical protein VFR61_08705 [Nitrososphaeraceae archaeon]|nr:hypothetical protein [Nitrososphaeraceae archaeon]
MKYFFIILTFLVILILPSIGYSQSTNNSTVKDGQEVKLITPIQQRISDKGTYLVAIKSGQSPISAGLNIEIVFLNKTSPYLSAPPPNSESNLSSTEYNKTSGMVIPSVVERTLPVKSYDIVINSGDGKEIWKKVDQVPQGGRGPQSIVLDNYDIGNITISITNIEPDSTIVDSLNQNSNNSNQFAALNQTESEFQTDSVKFQTTILVI